MGKVCARGALAPSRRTKAGQKIHGATMPAGKTQRRSYDDLDAYMSRSPTTRRVSKGAELDARPSNRRSKDDSPVAKRRSKAKVAPDDSSPGGPSPAGGSSPATARTPSASSKQHPVVIRGAKDFNKAKSPEDKWRDSPPKKKKGADGKKEEGKSSKSKKKGRPELVRQNSNSGRRRSSVSTGMSKVAPRALRGLCADRTPVVLELASAQQAARGLGLSQANLKHLRDKFQEIDIDSSGVISCEELLEAMEEKRTPLTDAIFRLIDLDGNGEISFDEFVCCLVSYCIYTSDDILQFIFQQFDEDDSGYLEEKEFTHLCKAINCGDPLFSGNFNNALAQFDTNQDGLIDFDEFVKLNKRYPTVLCECARALSARSLPPPSPTPRHPRACRSRVPLAGNDAEAHAWTANVEAHHGRLRALPQRRCVPKRAPRRGPVGGLVRQRVRTLGAVGARIHARAERQAGILRLGTSADEGAELWQVREVRHAGARRSHRRAARRVRTCRAAQATSRGNPARRPPSATSPTGATPHTTGHHKPLVTSE